MKGSRRPSESKGRFPGAALSLGPLSYRVAQRFVTMEYLKHSENTSNFIHSCTVGELRFSLGFMWVDHPHPENPACIITSFFRFLIAPCAFLYQEVYILEAPGWLSQLGILLLILGLWDRALCSAGSLLRILSLAPLLTKKKKFFFGFPKAGPV